MRIWTGLTAALLLCALTACGGNDVLEDVPPEEREEGTAEPGGAAPAEAMENAEVYDCGGVEIALPREYLDLLEVETAFDPSGLEGYTPLMNVLEKASVEAAERDFQSHEDVGVLFGFARLNQGAYEQLQPLAGYGIDFFARDGETYYAQTSPSTTQFYRGEAIDRESEDWKSWETLAGLAEPVREEIIRRNGLTPMEE